MIESLNETVHFIFLKLELACCHSGKNKNMQLTPHEFKTRTGWTATQALKYQGQHFSQRKSTQAL
jgi:hypothetical protein